MTSSQHVLPLVPLALGLIAGGAAAAELSAPSPSVAQVTPVERPDQNLADPAKRVLVYDGGRAVRGLTRHVDGEWELRRGGSWVRLGAQAPLSHREESALLAEARKLAKQAPQEDLVARNLYAAWLIRVGLHEEARGELDGILTVDPDFEAALDLIQAPAFVPPRTRRWLDAPAESCETLVRAAQTAGPVQRELLIDALALLAGRSEGGTSHGGVDGTGKARARGEGGGVHGGMDNPAEESPHDALVRKTLLRHLHSPEIPSRSFAAHALRRLYPGQEIKSLLKRCVLDVAEPVRKEAALAVRMAQQPSLTLPLIKALGSSSRAIRTNATESLGILGYSNAVPALVNHYAGLSSSGGVMPITSHIRLGSEVMYIQDFDVEIAQASSIADPIPRTVSDVVQLEARVGGVSGYTYITEKKTIYRSLKQLTGADPGSSPKDWSQWFEKQGESDR